MCAMRLAASYPSPALAWGGCIGDLRSPWLNKRRQCSASAMREATIGWGDYVIQNAYLFSKNPHPGSLRSPTLPTRGREKKAQAYSPLIVLPRKGEGEKNS